MLSCRNCEGRGRDEGAPDLAKRIADVRADVEFLRSAMEHWGGNSAEMAKARADIRDYAAAQTLQGARLDDLAYGARAAQEDMEALSRLAHGIAEESRSEAAKRAAELSAFMDDVRNEVAGLAARVSYAEEAGRTRLEGKAQELEGFIRAVDAEQAKGVADLQCWRSRVDARLEEIAVRAQDGDSALRHVRRMQRELEEHQDLQKSAHEVLEGSLNKDATSLLEKQALLSSELHRQMKLVNEHLSSTERDLQTRLLPELVSLRAQVGECRSWASRRAEQCDAECREGLASAQEALRQELSEEAARLGSRCDALAEDVSLCWATFREADDGIRAQVASNDRRLDHEVTACRAWAAEQVQAEYGRMLGLLRAETESLRNDMAGDRADVERLRTASTGAEQRLDGECATLRERLDAAFSDLAASEARLQAEDYALRGRLDEVAESLARADGRSTAEDAALRESLAQASAVRAQVEEQLSSRIEWVSTSLAAVDSRLSCEDAAARERMAAMSEEHSKSVARTAQDLACVHERLEGLTATVAKAESRLDGEDALARERLAHLAADVANIADVRLQDLRRELLAGDERLSLSLAALEQRLAAEGAAARQRDDGLAATVGAVDARLGEEAACLRERLEAIGMRVSSADGAFATRAAALAEQLAAARAECAAGRAALGAEGAEAGRRIDAVAAEVAKTAARMDAGDAAARAKFDAAAQALAVADERLTGEDRVTKARLQALSASVAKLDSRCSTEHEAHGKDIAAQAAAMVAVEARLRSEIGTVLQCVETVRASSATAEGRLGAEDAALREKLEVFARDLHTVEARLNREMTGTRAQLEQRFKEDVAWLLAMVQHSQSNVEKLAGAFRSLGSSHERCQSEFEMLGNVVRGVEVRTFPWRSGVDAQGLKALRCATPPPHRPPSQRPSTARGGHGPKPSSARRFADSPLPHARPQPSAVDSPPLAALRAVCNSPAPADAEAFA